MCTIPTAARTFTPTGTRPATNIAVIVVVALVAAAAGIATTVDDVIVVVVVVIVVDATAIVGVAAFVVGGVATSVAYIRCKMVLAILIMRMHELARRSQSIGLQI